MSPNAIGNGEHVNPFAEDALKPVLDMGRRDRDVSLVSIFYGGEAFIHEYDFGSMAELSLRGADIGPAEL